MLLDGRGCWLSRWQGRDIVPGAPALFLDRDNVLLADPGYLHRPSQVVLLEGAADVITWANTHSIPAIVVTNQSGIARGLYGWDDFHAINHRMQELLGAAGASVDALVACAWHEDGLEHLRCIDHPWRKPQPGMILAAANAYGCDTSNSWMVGDRQTDMQAAENAGLRGGIWIGGEIEGEHLWPTGDAASFAVVTAQSMTDVVRILSGSFQIADDLRSSADAL